MKIIKKIKESEKSIGLTRLSRDTGVSRAYLWGISNGKKGKYRKQTLDVLYEHYGLDRDERYINNMKKRNPPTFSVIGSLLRKARIDQGLSMREVARIIKGDKREVARIEAGDSLPSYDSYYMQQLIELYELTDQERHVLMWLIPLLKDAIECLRKRDGDWGAIKKLGLDQ